MNVVTIIGSQIARHRRYNQIIKAILSMNNDAIADSYHFTLAKHMSL